MSILPSFVILALLAGPTSLHYRYRANDARRFAATQSVLQTVRFGTGEPIVVRRATTALSEERKVLTVSGSSARVEEHIVDGLTTVDLPLPKSVQVVSPVSRVYTLDAQGRSSNMERRAPPGVAPPTPQFLDGLTIPLSPRPVTVGATWSGTVQTLGPDAKSPFAVTYAAKLAGIATRMGHTCARIEVKLAAGQISNAASAAHEARLTGNYVEWFATDLGLDIDVSGEITLVTSGKLTVGGKEQDAIETTVLAYSRVMK